VKRIGLSRIEVEVGRGGSSVKNDDDDDGDDEGGVYIGISV
jgi:hypothetical protein